MKIEMGESLMLSWAKHVKHCQIATLNWKCSGCWEGHNHQEIDELIENMKKMFSEDVFGKAASAKQIISQAELDVLGINVDNNAVKDIYAIDIAFHENGLLYKDNLHKITEKLLRSALVLYSVFNVKNGNIIFASPKVQPKDVGILQTRTTEIEQFMRNHGFDFKFVFLCNQQFYEEILLPVQTQSEKIADTSELFMRCLKMLSLFKTYNTTDVLPEKIVMNKKTRMSEGCRQSGATMDPRNNLVAFCFSCGHEGLYPYLNLGDALQKAADKLGIKKKTLSNLRDTFDRHNPHSPRQGWDRELNSVQKPILNKYQNNVAEAFDEAKKILQLI